MMTQDLFVLEYNSKEGIFHYNESYFNGKFRQGLFTNDYYPICILPDSYMLNEEFADMLHGISLSKLPFTEASAIVLGWFMKRNEI